MSAPFAAYHLPPEQEKLLKKAQRVAWVSLFFMATIIAAVGLTMGSSQAMKAMWVEDLVSLIPSAAFLVGVYFRGKKPDDKFPYGYRRAVLIAYLAGSVALLGFGVWVFGDSVHKLVTAEHPTIQTVGVFGHRVWLGWLMVAALAYSTVPPFVLGRMKYRLARQLHDKALHTSGKLDKGDWLAGLAGIAGILGIACGFWWADSVAAGFISAEIVKDGCLSLRNSVNQLMNARPTDVEGRKKDPLVDEIEKVLAGLDWVAAARVRLREDGDVLTGEAFVVPRGVLSLAKLEQAAELIHALDWRLHDVNVVPVRALK
jgi:cation diffusion facilitator family transporter